MVAASGALGAVVVLALLWVFSWRRKSYVVDWSASGVRITGAGHDVAFPWDSLERVLVRTDTDYARVELRKTDGASATLLAGFGSQDAKKPHAIDQIPDGVVTLLRRHQFAERTRERNARALRLFVRDVGLTAPAHWSTRPVRPRGRAADSALQPQQVLRPSRTSAASPP